MAGIDHAPPPFFKRGPAPLALLTFYIAVSLATFVLDLRFKSLDLLRQSVALVVDPVQRVAQTPGSLVDYAAGYLRGLQALQQENQELKHSQLATAPNLQRLAQLEVENERLRKLLSVKEREKAAGQVTQILYTARHRRDRRRRPGHACLSVLGRNHADHRQGSGGAGADRAQRPALGRLRTGQRSAGIALHARQRRHPGRRRAGYLRP